MINEVLIGIAGPAGSGKDTIADYLCQVHPFTRLAFAGPLKKMLAAGGFPEPADRAQKEAQIEGFDFSWRQAAQQLGTEFGRALDPDIWLKMTAREIRQRQSAIRNAQIVITDVRFENEANLIRGMGGHILHLYGRKVDLGAAAGHKSEGGVMLHPDDDYTINNSGTLEELYDNVEGVLYDIKKKGAK